MIEGKADVVLRLGDDLGSELLAPDGKGRVLYDKLLGIQPYDRRCFGKLQVDVDGTSKRVLVWDRCQLHAVSDRAYHIGGQAQLGWCRGIVGPATRDMERRPHARYDKH